MSHALLLLGATGPLDVASGIADLAS